MKKHLLMSLAFLLTFLCFDKVNATNLSLAWTKTPSANYGYRIAKFSPNGKKVAVGVEISDYDTNLTVQILNASTGDSLMSLSGHKTFVIISMAWLNDSTLATGDLIGENSQPRTLRIWNVNTGENIHTFFNDTLYPWHSAISNIVYLKGKNKLYVDLYTDARVQINSSPPWTYAYYSDSLLVINTLTWEIIKPICFSDSNNYHKIDLVCGAPDGSYYVITNADHEEIRNPDNDSLILRSDSTFHFSFDKISLNGKYGIETVSNAVGIKDIENRRFLQFLEFDSINNVSNAVISPDSRYIAVTGYYENKDYHKLDRFAYAEIENPTNRFLQDSIVYADKGFEASNDSLYLLFLEQGKIWVYNAPWSPLNSINTKPVDSEQSILYPNPTNGKVKISGLNEPVQNVIITDVNGTEIKKYSDNDINSADNNIELNISDLPNGIYFITIKNEKTTVNKVYKLIKK